MSIFKNSDEKKTPFLLGFYRVGEFKTSNEEQESGGDGELTSAA